MIYSLCIYYINSMYLKDVLHSKCWVESQLFHIMLMISRYYFKDIIQIQTTQDSFGAVLANTYTIFNKIWYFLPSILLNISCFARIWYLKHLRGYLTREVALTAPNALVGSQLGYSNSLFRNLSALDLHNLQCVQNSLAEFGTNTTKYSYITPVRKTPLAAHWASLCI